MKKFEEILNNLKEQVNGILGTMLISERMNSQRCIAKDIDTTKTIIDYKDEFTQEDLNKTGHDMSKLTKDLKGLLNEILISERMNSQRCIAKDIDTTKTIVDYKNEEKEFTKEDVNSLVKEAKTLINTMLVSERMNSQRCTAKDIDTTKTIVEHKDEEKEFTKEEVKNVVEEAKTLINTMLVSERMNSQRCIAKDIDTTKTIIDKK